MLEYCANLFFIIFVMTFSTGHANSSKVLKGPESMNLKTSLNLALKSFTGLDDLESCIRFSHTSTAVNGSKHAEDFAPL